MSLVAYERAAAQSCPGVSVLDTLHSGVVNPSTGRVECVVIPGAELSFDGRVAPLVNFGAPQNLTTYTYDSLGRIPVETSSLGTTTTTYDGLGRIATAIDPQGHTTTFVYDAQGRLETEIIDSPAPDQRTTFIY